MAQRVKTKYVHEGKYVAEVEVAQYPVVSLPQR